MRQRIVLADDHALILDALRRLLESEYDVVATALDGREMMEAVQATAPDLVIMDISMPHLNGIEAAQRIRQSAPDVKIVVASQHTDRSYVEAAFSAGASGYVPKLSRASELLTAVQEVLAGRIYVSSTLGGTSALLNLQANSERRRSFGYGLTRRQREVLQLVSEGRSTKEMAYALQVSYKTIEFHKANLMEVLGLRTTAELTRYALEHGISGAGFGAIGQN
jgi:DNA-binding NarL/FixJ family response regulator